MSLYCSKCGCYPTYSSGCCICGSNQLSFDENKSTKTYPAAEVERLVAAAQEIYDDIGEGECTKELKAALAALKDE